MAETEGPTCTTCLTLNPPGAPACIRCNSPLTGPAPARVPSPTDVPGLAPAPPAAQPATNQTPPSPTAPSPTAPSQALPGQALPGQAPPSQAPPGSPPSPAVQAQGYAVPAPAGPPTGLAVPPRGTPGGSRSAAAPVQPPGYGMGTADGPSGPVGLSPAEQRRISRRIAVVGTLVVLLVLAGGGAALWWLRPRYLDADAVAARIGVELTQRLREPVTVRCPASPRQRAGETFRCTAANGRGISQPVTVTVLDRAGRYRWTLGG